MTTELDAMLAKQAEENARAEIPCEDHGAKHCAVCHHGDIESQIKAKQATVGTTAETAATTMPRLSKCK